MKIQNDPIRFELPINEENALKEWSRQYEVDSALEAEKRKNALRLALQS